MESRKCHKCDRELEFSDWYGICVKCGVLIPESKERMIYEINEIVNLREELKSRLHILTQKEINSEKLTKQESKEIKAWINFNTYKVNFDHYADRYEINYIRKERIYPILYRLKKSMDEIKELYLR